VFAAIAIPQQVCPACVEKQEKAIRDARHAARVREQEQRLADAGILGDFLTMTFERFSRDAQPEAFDAAWRFVEGWPGQPGLAFLGEVGTGKTHLAVAIARAILMAGEKVRVVHVPTLTWRLATAEDWAATARALVDPLESLDLVVLDDLGREKTTDRFAEALDRIVHVRHRDGRPLVVTMNLELAELRRHLGLAAASRFLSEAEVVRMQPGDRRLLRIVE
jgi:DNA replication protein DnaC